MGNLAAPLASVELVLFGGLFTEAPPESLPQGASPLTINIEYEVGQISIRPGVQNAFYYPNTFYQQNPNFGQNIITGPNETAWVGPNNITLDNPGNPAIVALSSLIPSASPLLEISTGVTSVNPPPPVTPCTLTTPQNSPANMFAWAQLLSNASESTPAGWTGGGIIGGGFDYYTIPVGSGTTVPPFSMDAGSGNIATMITLWQTDGLLPNSLQVPGATGGSTQVPVTPSHVFSAGTSLMMLIHLVNSNISGTPTPFDINHSGVTDTSGNTWVFIGTVQTLISFVGESAEIIFICQNPIPNVAPTITATMRSSGGVIMSCSGMNTNIAEVAHIMINGIFGPVDQQATGASNNNTVFVGPITPTFPNSTVFVLECHNSANPDVLTPPAGWGQWPTSNTGFLSFGSLWMTGATTGPVSFTGTFAGSASQWAALMINMPNSGPVGPYPFQQINNAGGWPPSSTYVFPSNTTLGNMIFVCFLVQNVTSAPVGVTSVTDTQGNTYTILENGGQSNGTAFVAIAYAQAIKSAPCTVTIAVTGSSGSACVTAFELYMGPTPPSTNNISQVLQGINYPLNIPLNTEILGLELLVGGNQTSVNPGSIVTISLNQPGAETFTAQLPTSNAITIFGGPLNKWNLVLTPALLNSGQFAAQIQAQTPSGVPDVISVYGFQFKVFVTPIPPPKILYLKTFAETDGDVTNLALGDNGVMYGEDAINAPQQLNTLATNFLPGSYAESCTEDDREFIAVSNLINGTDVPRTFTPPNVFDRLSQVGPGNAPAVQSASGTTTSSPAILSITQPAPVEIRRIAWGSDINAQTSGVPGSILVIYLPGGSTHGGAPAANLNPGDQIWISGVPNPFPKKGGGSIPFNINSSANGVYQVIEVGQPVIGGSETDTAITVQAPGVAYGYSNDFGVPPTSGWFYQATLATVTTASQVPGLEVGGQIQIAGTGGGPPAGYDGTWPVTTTPNASQVQITSTSLTSNLATYSYTLITGVNPVAGEAITITGCLNGNGIFNQQASVIQSASPGSFTLNLVGPNIPSDAESNATGVIFGTIFTFDPGQLVGNISGKGEVVVQGTVDIGAKQCCYSFLTRNGYLTQPSLIAKFTVLNGAQGIIVSNLLTGPSNVIARVVHFTAADGVNFYNIPENVQVTNALGQTITETSTWVLDNTSTTATFSFSDTTLLASDQIDIPGNNLFEDVELGAPTMLIQYAQRVWAINEQNKVPNFNNWSFDGGIIGNNSQPGGGANTTSPAGWTVDPTNGGGVSVVNSPVFGFAFQIQNTTGSTQGVYGMIWQDAYQDEFLVSIINASTAYSVRVTACVPSGLSSGTLITDLFSPSLARVIGSFAIPLATLGTTMQISTGPILLQPGVAPVPPDLRWRIYAAAMPTGVTIQVDRAEVFPTENPNLNGQIIGSYQGNFEAFDRVTGVIQCNVQNQQPVNSAFTLFDAMYMVKFHSLISTKDNQTTEPNNWASPRVISNAVGTSSVYGVTTGIDEPNSGEEWAIIAGIAGLFIFNGGQPVKISEEIQSLWDMINWAFGFLLWVKNDIVNRRILVGCPMKTLDANGNQNKWIPAAALSTGANPTFNNCILELNYKQLNTEGLLSEKIGVRTSYSAKLIASEITRKWSVWTIQAPCAAFLQRNDNTSPLFLGNSASTGKIYDLIDGFIQDDGSPIYQSYNTYGFVQGETGQGMQMGVGRYNYDYMTMILDGAGTLAITVYPNTLDTPYSHVLLPDLTLPASTNGDTELPVNECASRLFLNFNCNAIGSFFTLKRVVLVMHQDPWAPVRGVNT